MDASVAFEHKSLNNDILACISAQDLPLMYRVQMEQQLMISGASKCLFMATRWDDDDALLDEKHFWYEPDLDLRAKIIAGWEQFEKDLATFQPTEYIPAATAAPIRELPVLDIQISGSIVSSNLATWAAVVSSRIDAINTNLETDQDFADAAETVKFLDDGEKRIDLVKSQAQAQACSIDEAFRAMDEIKATMRSKRLELDKLVTARKEAIKTEAVLTGKTKLAEFLVDLNIQIGKPYMPLITADFGAAIKGKRTIATLHDAVNTLLSQKQAEATAIAKRIEANLKTLRDHADGFAFLFSDTSALVLKDTDAVEAIAKQRVAEHKAAEDKRLTEAREKIAAEERAKLEREQAEKQAEEDRKAAAAACIANETNTPREAPQSTAKQDPPEKVSAGTAETGIQAPTIVASGRSIEINRKINSAARPSDDSIIATLSLHYRVHESKVIEWLLEIDLKAASERMAMEFAA